MIHNSADKYQNIVSKNARIHNTKMKSTSKRSNAHHKMIHEYINKENRFNNHNIIKSKAKATNNSNTKDNASIINNSNNNNNIKNDNNNNKKKPYNKDNETNGHATNIQKPKTNTTTQKKKRHEEYEEHSQGEDNTYE